MVEGKTFKNWGLWVGIGGKIKICFNMSNSK